MGDSQAPAEPGNEQGAGRFGFVTAHGKGGRSVDAAQDEHREAFCFASIWFNLPTSCRLLHMYSRKDARRLWSAATSLSFEGGFSSVEKSFCHRSTFQYLRSKYPTTLGRRTSCLLSCFTLTPGTHDCRSQRGRDRSAPFKRQFRSIFVASTNPGHLLDAHACPV